MNKTTTVNLQETKLPLATITIKDGEVKVKTTGSATGNFAKVWIEIDKENVKVGEEVTVRLILRLYHDVRRVSTGMIFDYKTSYLDNDVVEVTFAHYRNFRYGHSLQFNNGSDIVYIVEAYDYYVSKGTYEVAILKFRIKKEAYCSIRVRISYTACDYKGNYEHISGYQIVHVNAYNKRLLSSVNMIYYITGGLSFLLGIVLLLDTTNLWDPAHRIKSILSIILILIGLATIMYATLHQYPINFIITG